MTDKPQPAGDRILVVDDEPDIIALVAYHLVKHGYRVSTASDGIEAIRAAKQDLPALIILDLMLPGKSGYEVLEELRAGPATKDTAVLMLTARKEEEDRIRGLALGADDYLTKPFGVSELLARIRVALRHARAQSVTEDPVIAIGPIRVDQARHEVTLAEAPVHLTPIEFRLLAYLARHAGKVLTHRQLLHEVWGPRSTQHTQYLRVHMAALRKKLEADPARPRWLTTEPGVGYRLREQ